MGKLWLPAAVHWVTIVPMGETLEAASAGNMVCRSRTTHTAEQLVLRTKCPHCMHFEGLYHRLFLSCRQNACQQWMCFWCALVHVSQFSFSRKESPSCAV